MSLRSYSGNAKRTSLVGPITSGSTTLSVLDATGYPSDPVNPFVIALDLGLAGEEKLTVTRSGNTFTVVQRGFDDTAAASHNAGATVDHVLSATDIREINTHVYNPGADPHPEYLTPAEGATLYASSAHGHGETVATHVAASDPHAQYLTQTEGDARYPLIAHTHATGGGAPYLALFNPTDGTASSNTNTAPNYHRVRPLADVTISALKVYISGTSGSVCLGVYSNSSGAPANRLATTGSVPASTVGLLTAPLTTPLSLTAGTDYWLAFVCDNTTAAFACKPLVGAGQAQGLAQEFLRSSTTSSFPLPTTAGTTGSATLTNIPVIYAAT